jgi:hypothetical protein
LHKPIFILVEADHKFEVSAHAERFLDKLIQDGDHDWYQGMIKSERWSEYTYFNSPRLVSSDKSQAIIKKFIESQENEILEWIRQGNKELKEGKNELDWTLSNFRIASGDIPIHLFDYSGWSEGSGIKDQKMIDDITKYNKTRSQKLYIIGYDIHY